MTHAEFKQRWIPHSQGFLVCARSMLGSEADAWDAVQDLYVRLWNMRSRLDEVENPKAYGLAMIRNICLDTIRKRSSHPTEDLFVTDALSQDIPADRLLVSKEDSLRLQKAIQGLQPLQAELIRLRYFEDLSYDEIARKTGLSKVNLRVSIMRAKQTLKTLMRNER